MSRDIMIACVTVEVAMVVSPVLRYKPQELHLFRFIRDPGSRKSKLYTDHFNDMDNGEPQDQHETGDAASLMEAKIVFAYD